MVLLYARMGKYFEKKLLSKGHYPATFFLVFVSFCVVPCVQYIWSGDAFFPGI